MMKGKNSFFRSLVLFCVVYQFVDIVSCNNVKKSVENDNREDNGDIDENNAESLDIPADNETNNITCTRRQNSQMHEITAAKHKQFPFMAAVMSRQNEYLCSGSVVSNGLILTTAKCTQQPASYVLLNTTKDKKDDAAVVLHVTKTEKFPSYAGSDTDRNVGLIYTEKHNSSVASKVRLSNITSLSSIVDIEGIGFGLNAEVGQPKELQYVGMEHRSNIMALDVMQGFLDCVETKVLTCYKDTGGPVIVDNELVGIVAKGQDECSKEISSTYAINKKLADIIPTFTFKGWLDDRIQKNEEQEEVSLAVYPTKPALRDNIHKLTTKAGSKFGPALFVNFFVMLLTCLVN